MKKYVLKFAVFVVSSFLFCSNILAYTSTLVSSKSTVNPGNTFTIKINTSGLTNGLGSAEYTLTYDSSLFEATNVTSNASSNILDSSVKLTFVDMTGKSPLGNGTFATITFKVKNVTVDKSGTFSLSSKETSDKDLNNISSTNKGVSVKVHIPDTDNTLKSLTIDGTSVTGFNANTLNYSFKTANSSLNIAASANSSTATVSGTGKKSVSYGTNTYNIVVTAENGSKKTYKITVTRDDNRETINTLNSLSVDGYSISPTFNKSTLNYTLNVDSNVSKIKVKASKTSTKSSFVSGFGEREVSLNYGENKVYVKVKAENEKVNTYTIVVNRKDNRSKNNNLKSLTSSIGNIQFDKDITTYSILTDQSQIVIGGEVEDSKATIDGAKTYTLKEGLNEIKVNVKAENGSVKTYIIKVTKASDFASLNISNNLKGLSVLKNYGINFKKDTYEYNVTIDDEKSLELDLELEDKNATYVVKGNEDLKDGSIISIIVTSLDGKSKEYKLNINKENNNVDEILPEKKGGISLNLILLIISFTLNIVLIIFLLSNKSKKEPVKLEENSSNIISQSEVIETEISSNEEVNVVDETISNEEIVNENASSEVNELNEKDNA